MITDTLYKERLLPVDQNFLNFGHLARSHNSKELICKWIVKSGVTHWKEWKAMTVNRKSEMLFSPILYIPQICKILEASKWGQVFIKEKKQKIKNYKNKNTLYFTDETRNSSPNSYDFKEILTCNNQQIEYLENMYGKYFLLCEIVWFPL